MYIIIAHDHELVAKPMYIHTVCIVYTVNFHEMYSIVAEELFYTQLKIYKTCTVTHTHTLVPPPPHTHIQEKTQMAQNAECAR